VDRGHVTQDRVRLRGVMNTTMNFSDPVKFFHTFNLHICNKSVCSVSVGSWMSHAQWRNLYTRFSFVRLGTILILELRFYSGVSDRDRTEYLFGLCVVSLLSSTRGFIASALVSFYNALKCLVFYLTQQLNTKTPHTARTEQQSARNIIANEHWRQKVQHGIKALRFRQRPVRVIWTIL
jgi:hypothetical protein